MARRYIQSVRVEDGQESSFCPAILKPASVMMEDGISRLFERIPP